MINSKGFDIFRRKLFPFLWLAFLLIVPSVLLMDVEPSAYAQQTLPFRNLKGELENYAQRREPVQTSAPQSINAENKSISAPYPKLFLTDVSAGVGNFVNTGQRVGIGAWSTGVGDLNNDGYLDLFMANKYDRPNEVWLNNGTGYFVDSGQRLGNENSEAVALGDLDNDGDLDAFVGNTGTQPNYVWLNLGNGVFLDSGQRLGNEYSTAVALGDLDGDGDVDAFVCNWDGQPDQVWFNNGNGTFTKSPQVLGGMSSRAVKLGDLDQDGDLDAFVGTWGGNYVWKNNGQGFFLLDNPPLGVEYTVGVALGDLNGDLTLDAFTVSRDGQPNRVWLNDGTGNFISNGEALGYGHSEAVALGDIDQDGDLDAIIANGIYGDLWPEDEVWLNDGNASFSNAYLPLSTANSEAVALGDFNNDGALDLFVGNGYVEEPGNQIYLNLPGCVSTQLCNGNFEQNIQYWQFDSPFVLTSPGHNGLYGLRSEQDKTALETVSWAGLRQLIQVIPGQSYTYSFWLRSENASNAHIKLDWFNAAGTMLGSTQLPINIPANSGSWMHFTGQINAVPGASTAEIAFWHGVSDEVNVPGSVLILDDLAISPAPCAGEDLCNLGFEKGTAGWEIDEAALLVTDAYSGTWALQTTQQRLVTSSAAWAGIRQYTPVIAEKAYTISTRARWQTVTNLHIKLIWYDASGTEIGTSIIYDQSGTSLGTGEWVLLEGTAFAPVNASMAQLVIWHGVNQANENVPGSQVTLDEISFNLAGSGVEKPWTVLVYLNGDNNLDEETAVVFNKLEASADNPNVNIVVLWDRSTNTGGLWDSGTSWYHVQYDTNPYELAQYVENINMWDKEEQNLGDDYFLYTFVNWARSSFPADHYLLMITDHGGGWSPELPDGLPRRGGWALGGTGLSWDDTGLNGEPDFLSTHETGEALRVLSDDGENPFDIVFYDACLMGMLEEVYEVRNYTNYLIASENVAWATFPYDYYINAITHSIQPSELAIQIANGYIQSLPPSYAGTVSVYDLDQASNIAAQTNALANAMIQEQENPIVRGQIGDAYLSSQKVDYDSDGQILPEREGYVDLYDFVQKLEALVTAPDIILAAEPLLASLDSVDFIIHEAHQSGQWDIENTHGLSIYMPFGEELYIGSKCNETTTDPCSVNYDPDCVKLRNFYTTVTPPQVTQLAFTQNSNWDEFINGFIEAEYCSSGITADSSNLPETRIISVLNSARQGNLLAAYQIYLPLLMSGN